MNTLERDLLDLSRALNQLAESFPLTLDRSAEFRPALEGITFDTDEATYELVCDKGDHPRGPYAEERWRVTKEFKPRTIELKVGGNK